MLYRYNLKKCYRNAELILSRNFKSQRLVGNSPGAMGNILPHLIVLVLFFCGVIGAENEVKIGRYLVNVEKYSNTCSYSSSIRSINQILDYFMVPPK